MARATKTVAVVAVKAVEAGVTLELTQKKLHTCADFCIVMYLGLCLAGAVLVTPSQTNYLISVWTNTTYHVLPVMTKYSLGVLGMTRKDYILIADALGQGKPASGNREVSMVWWVVVLNTADALGNDNPRFDRNRFIAHAEGKN